MSLYQYGIYLCERVCVFVFFKSRIYKEQGVCSLKKHLAHLVSYMGRFIVSRITKKIRFKKTATKIVYI